MNRSRCALLATAALLALPLLHGQASPFSILAEIKTLRSLSAEQRPIKTIKVAGEISALRPGMQ